VAVDKTNIDFGTTPGDDDFTISNNGTGVLTWTATETDPDNVFSLSSTGGSINPGDDFTVTVTFTAGAVGEHTGSVKVEADEPDASGTPVTVTLDAETT
jgi:hypothetical protein